VFGNLCKLWYNKKIYINNNNHNTSQMKIKNYIQKALLPILSVGFAVLGFVVMGAIFQADADTAVNAEFTFQGKIVNSDGTNVTAGSPSCVVAGASNDTCDFQVIMYDSSTNSNGTGTITSSGTAVTGSGTIFDSELASGDFIYASGEVAEVSSVNSASSVTLVAAFSSDISSGVSFEYISPIWSEEHEDQEIGAYDGVFTLEIGSIGTGFNAAAYQALASDSAWIEISFDPAGGKTYSQVFSPRKNINPVPQSISSRQLVGSSDGMLAYLPILGDTTATDLTTGLNLNAANQSLEFDFEGTTFFTVDFNEGYLNLASTTQPTGVAGDIYTDGTDLFFYNGSSWDDLTASGGGGGDFSNDGEDGTADRTLGNTDNYDLGFLTNGLNRLQIQNDGKVGIGTTEPTYRLDVIDDSAASYPARFRNDNQYSMLQVQTLETSDTSNRSGIEFRMLSSTTDRSVGGIRSGWTDNTDATRTSIMEFKSNNNGSLITAMSLVGDSLGIGTETPSNLLEVSGDSAQLRLTDESATNYAEIEMENDGTDVALKFMLDGETDDFVQFLTSGDQAGIYFENGTYDPGILFDNSDNELRFYGANGSEQSLAMTITATQITNHLPTTFEAVGDVDLAYDLIFSNSSAAYVSFEGGPGYIETDHPSGNYDLTLSAANAGHVVLNDDVEVGGDFDPITDNTYALGDATHRFTALYATNGTIQTSDATLKTNIEDIQYGLDEVMLLSGVSFNWIGDEDGRVNLGYLAQEVLEIVPEIVYIDEESGLMGLSYTSFIPILTRAIQEQQFMITDLERRVAMLEDTVGVEATFVERVSGTSFQIGDALIERWDDAGRYFELSQGELSGEYGVVNFDGDYAELASLYSESSLQMNSGGMVPVKVSTENGAISPGDYLIPSELYPGYLMKACGDVSCYNALAVGQATEEFGVDQSVDTDAVVEYLNSSLEAALLGWDEAYAEIESMEITEEDKEALRAVLITQKVEVEKLYSVGRAYIEGAGRMMVDIAPRWTAGQNEGVAESVWQTLDSGALSFDGTVSATSFMATTGGFEMVSAEELQITDALTGGSDGLYFMAPIFVTSDIGGQVTIPAGITEIVVANTNANMDSIVQVTSLNGTQGLSDDVSVAVELGEGQFTIVINNSVAYDTVWSYLILLANE
jgi:hypothetical protein